MTLHDVAKITNPQYLLMNGKWYMIVCETEKGVLVKEVDYVCNL